MITSFYILFRKCILFHHNKTTYFVFVSKVTEFLHNTFNVLVK